MATSQHCIPCANSGFAQPEQCIWKEAEVVVEQVAGDTGPEGVGEAALGPELGTDRHIFGGQ